MEIILLERIPSLGQIGQIVKVRPGYARNYLFPRKKPSGPQKKIAPISNRIKSK